MPVADVLQYGALGLLLLVLLGLYRLGAGAVRTLAMFFAGVRADIKSEMVDLVGEIRRMGDKLEKQAVYQERRHGELVAHVTRTAADLRAAHARQLESASAQSVRRVLARETGPISVPPHPHPKAEPGE